MGIRLKHWIWMGTKMDTPDEEWQRLFARMKAAGIDAVLPEVVNSGGASYGSGHLPVRGECLEQILPLAREAGIEVHAWMHSMPCTVPEIVEGHPEWYGVNGRGESAATKPAYVNYYKFLCPSRPEVQEFVRTRVIELSEYEGLASVHLDYIRFPDVILASSLQPKYGIVQDREYPQYDYCYCEVCRAMFREQAGVDPLELEDPSANEEWRQFRCDRINHMVGEVLAPAARRAGKQVTAAVFPNWWHVRQQWFKWDLDAVLPMLYHSFYEEDIDWVKAQCMKGVELLPESVPLYSGLFVPALRPEQIPEAVRASIAGGAQGVSLFAAGSMSDEHWEKFAEVNREMGKIS